jgi:hypothetical protein
LLALAASSAASTAGVVRWQVAYDERDVLKVQTEVGAPRPVTRHPPGSRWSVFLRSWSPRGRFLLFRRSFGRSGMYVLEIARKREVRLSSGVFSEWAWTRDDARLAFTESCPASESCDERIKVAELPSGRQSVAYRLPRRADREPAWISGLTWSPTSQELAFVTAISTSNPEEPRSGLYVLDLRNGVARTVVPENAEGFLDAPSWSPDGSLIAYGRRCTVVLIGGGDVYCEVAVTNPSGTETRLVISGGKPGDPHPLTDLGLVWRPGTREVVCAEWGGGIALAVGNALTGTERVFRGHAANDFAVSPDGRRLGYVTSAPFGRIGPKHAEVRVLNIRTGRQMLRRRLAMREIALEGTELRLP